MRLRDLLSPRPDGDRSTGTVIRWWEIRRPLYNLIVGVTGVFTLAALFTVGFLCERSGGEAIGIPDPPIVAVVAVPLYGLLANICYTGGWMAELIAAKIPGLDTRRFGPIAFLLGTAFSVLLTLAPAPIAAAVAVLTSCRGF